MMSPVPATARVQDIDDARSFNAYAAWSEAVIAQAFRSVGLCEEEATRRAACLPTVS
ncbi:hypothetical protein [Rhodococcus sp. NPDC006774]|uniref:hypothetical protein n=1 Tax=Rhodococcus sp. NPDC006774 TaxID=3157186 RepID=UPI0033DA925E